MKQWCSKCYAKDVRLWVPADRINPTLDDLVCLQCVHQGHPYVRAVSLDSRIVLVKEGRGPMHLLWNGLPATPDMHTETRRRAEDG